MNKKPNKKRPKFKDITQNPYLWRTFSQLLKVLVCVVICIIAIMLVTHTTLWFRNELYAL